MLINNLNKKVICFCLIFIFIIPIFVSADNSMKHVKDKIDDQNDYLYEKLLELRKEDREPLKGIIDESKKRDKEAPKSFDLGKVASNVHMGSLYLAITARKFIVPITILLMLFNVFMLSATGAKNFKNRKKYILGSVFLFVLFLVILNFPLYLLWRYSVGIEGFLSFEGFYRFAENVASFLKSNSFVFFIIIFTFGIINMISSENNYPKQMASKYLVRMSFILFALFNVLPFIFKLAV